MLNSLILTGGKSQRMGQDKASLQLRDGLTQLDRAKKLLSPVSDGVWISVAEPQGLTNELPDQIRDAGPLSGLHAALKKRPTSNWIVLACDLPLIESEVLENLKVQADPQRATAYRSRLDGRAEPLCAIYPASCYEPLKAWLAEDKRCARKFIESLNPKLLNLPEVHKHALDNFNTPEDLVELESHLNQTRQPKAITLLHFAKLRDEMGEPETHLTTECVTAAGVYDELRMSRGLSLKRQHLKVAINGNFADWSTRINAGDELAIIPPVSGG